MSIDEQVALWAISSYRGDATWLVHSSPVGGLAGEVWEGLRAHFVASPFIRAIQCAIAELRGEVAVSIQSQELGRLLYQEKAAEFLRAMYVAHNNGLIPFGDDPAAIEAWVSEHAGAALLGLRAGGVL